MFFENANAIVFVNSSAEPSELASIALFACLLIGSFWFFKNSSRFFNIFIVPLLNSSQRRKARQDWHPILTSRFYVQRQLGAEIWSIHFAGSQNLSFESIFSKNQYGFFELGRTPQETDGMLAPLMRKVILKYRSAFERNRPIQTMRTASPELMMTWLHNPSQFRMAIYRFLDECQLISQNLKCDPSLDIAWDQEFALTVMWKNTDPRFQEMFRTLLKPSPELVIVQNDHVIGLTLCLAFNERKMSKHITRLSSILRQQYTKLPDAG